jgi:tyrosinase
MAGSMVYRLPVRDAAEPHMVLFREAMAAAEEITDNRGYNHIAGFHGAPGWYCWHHQFSRRSPLQSRLFLPWHRAYLWWLEQALQDQVEGAALPWWDWTTERRVPRAYSARNHRRGSQPAEVHPGVCPDRYASHQPTDAARTGTKPVRAPTDAG